MDIKAIFEGFIADDLIDDRREYGIDDLIQAYPGIGPDGARQLYEMIQDYFK